MLIKRHDFMIHLLSFRRKLGLDDRRLMRISAVESQGLELGVFCTQI